MGGAMAAGLMTRMATGMMANELRLLGAVGRALSRRPIAPSEITFTRESTYPGVALALAIVVVIEGAPIHLLLRGHSAAQAVMLALHAYALLWIVGDLRALRESTCRFERRALVVQLGLRFSARIPFHLITAAGWGEPSGDAAPDEARITPGDTPNVALVLRKPIVVRGPFGIRRRARVVRLYVDDPTVLLAKLRAVQGISTQ